MSSTCVIASFTTLYLSLGSLFSHQKAQKKKAWKSIYWAPLSLWNQYPSVFPSSYASKAINGGLLCVTYDFMDLSLGPKLQLDVWSTWDFEAREKNQHFLWKIQKKPSGESRPIHGDSQVFARWEGFGDQVLCKSVSYWINLQCKTQINAMLR